MSAARRIVENTEKPMEQLLDSFKNLSADIEKLSTRLDTITNDTTESVVHLRKILRRVDNLLSDQQLKIYGIFPKILRKSPKTRKNIPPRYCLANPRRMLKPENDDEEKNVYNFLYWTFGAVLLFDGMFQL